MEFEQDNFFFLTKKNVYLLLTIHRKSRSPLFKTSHNNLKIVNAERDYNHCGFIIVMSLNVKIYFGNFN